MSSKFVKVLGTLFTLAVISFAVTGIMVYDTICAIAAPASRSKTIYELENELKSAEKEEKAIRAAIAKDTANAASYAREIQTLDSEIQILTDRLTIIEALNEQWQAQADETKAEIEELEERKEDEISAFEGMLKMSYLHGTDTYFNLIFGSQDIGDFLSRTDLIGYHLKANDNILSVLTQTIGDLENAYAVYDESLSKLDGYGSEQETLRTELEERSKIAAEKKAQYEADAAINKKLLEDKAKELRAMEAEIKRLYEESRKNNSSSNYTGGPFAMPLAAGTYRVSSGFEWRNSPINGKKELHNGLDLAAPGGTPIYAVASGTVIDSRYSNSWGNVIQIDHGGGVVTLYAHCSARLVSKGQTVSKGELIAKVGTTGWSTGNHLHFTVYKNGTAVDPRGSAYLNF